jgi:hypothetical protein
MKCEFCSNEFSNKNTLNSHQKTAKYCLLLRNVEAELYNCEHCKKGFTKLFHLQRHQESCKTIETNALLNLKFIEQENIDLKKKLQDTQLEYENKLSLKEKIIKKIRIENTQTLLEKDKIIEIQKKDLQEHKRVINELQEEYKKQMKMQNKDLQDRMQSMAEKAIERTWQTIVEIEQKTDTPDQSTDEPYELVPLELDNGYIIESREEDGYINITNLCKAGGKEFKAWNRLDKTKAFLKALSTAVGISTAVLIQLGTGSKFGTTEETSGTWVHPQVAINIAQWISPQFDVKVSAWVLEVMLSGKIDITNTKSYRELQEDNKNKQLKIQLMTKKYVKKQPRIQFDESNVVYILTTANMKKERRYILGKATNLTSRLSVYNKSDEHEVVYYQECPDEERMSVVETLVFCKLNEYREQANRERFLLPEATSIDLFSDTIKQCIAFVK